MCYAFVWMLAGLEPNLTPKLPAIHILSGVLENNVTRWPSFIQEKEVRLAGILLPTAQLQTDDPHR